MADIEERRYMDRLTQGLLARFSGIENFQLKDIVEFIVKEPSNSFNIGFFFLHDRVNKTFSLGDFFPKGDYTGEEVKIKAKLMQKKYDIDTAESPESACGLFYYVARNFRVNTEDENNYLAINNIDEFKKEENELARYNIDFIELQDKVKSQYIFPVYIANEKLHEGKRDKILHAVVVLVSFSEKNNIQRHDLKLLSDLISFIISVESRKLANRALHTFINTLSDVGTVKYSRTEYRKILNSLKQFYVDNEEKNTLKQCLLKHASIWTLNDIDPLNIFLVKEKNFNYLHEEIPITNIISNKGILGSDKPHYFFEFITRQIGKIKERVEKNEEIPFRELIEIQKFENIKALFYQGEKFQQSSEIENDDIVVLFPILPHLGKEQEERKDTKKVGFKTAGLLVFYFAQNTCAYYYKPDFLELIAHKIYENIQIVIQKTRRDIRQSIFEKLSSMLEDDKVFFQTATRVIKQTMDFEHCLIYLFNDDRTRLVLKIDGERTDFPREIEIENEASYGCLLDIVKNQQESSTAHNYFKDLKDDSGDSWVDIPHIWYSPEAIDPEVQIDAASIYSAMLIPIRISRTIVRGVLVCLNNRRDIDMTGKSEKSFFSLKDHEIASIGAESIAIYVEIFHLAGRYRQLLRRLAHEIPGQMNFIRQANTQIKEEFDSIFDRLQKKFGTETSQTIVNDYHRNLIFNLLAHQSQAARRVQLYAEYPRLEKLDPEHIRREIKPLNMNKFLASTIEDFRSTAVKHGVFVQFDFRHELPHQTKYSLEVHPLFELAVWNLINNAIQYAYFGTTIHIICEFGLQYNYIHVENIGIPIPGDMKDKIFAEGIRTEAARARYFKGAGLGLTLARQVVRAHKGDILINNKNDICRRNVFGIYELKKLLNKKSSDEDRDRYINQKSPSRKRYADFKQKLEFNMEENEILDKYRKFLISSSDRADKNLMKDCLDERFDGNENIDILFKREIYVPISFVRFSIKMPVNI